MVNFFRAAAAALMSFAGAAQAAAIGNQLSSGYVGSMKLQSTSPLTIRYSTSQPSDRNWIGVWPTVNGGGPENQRQGVNASSKWTYTPGLDGTVTIPTDGLAAGDYTAYFLADDKYTWQAAPIQFGLDKSYPGSIKVTPGYPISIDYSTSQPNEHNWIAIYFASGGGPDAGAQVDEHSIRWYYAPDSQGTITIPADGLGDGVYKAFFLSNDGYQSIASPQIFSLGNAVFPGALAVDYTMDTFTFRYTTQKAAAKNWIGVWRINEGPDDQGSGPGSLVWEYTPEARGVKKVDGSQLPSGQYKAYLLANDGRSWLASSLIIHK
ncbi:hypothetical protein NLG97_g3598 [Lecanicillium saksenae]|uniref:Uncharacterized protein n=1 Tax=Lecanicillium saksenae TaxID=468837 RepID=A0ACC1R0A7_9HYPO|nr:hypothetical protein NLG97_g3598 [Lecanicillium saksenae]